MTDTVNTRHETFNAFQLTRRRQDLAKARAERSKATASLIEIEDEAEALKITLSVTDWKIRDIRDEIKRRRAFERKWPVE